MGVNSLPKTVTRQRRDCDLNLGPSAPESSTLTTRPATLISYYGICIIQMLLESQALIDDSTKTTAGNLIKLQGTVSK